ncbi:MAG: sigma 54-interacting transcriptional regulator, partial [Terriglobales bacterium]
AARHLGKFEQAQHGTIFLDEIGDMPLTMQAKLLRVLEEGEVERIGGERPITIDVRVVVATHRDLETQVRDGKFRQDLFHRIFVFPLRLPPLRERREDIPALIEHFAKQVSAINGWKPMLFTADAISALQEQPWPGNVRELRNAVERLMLLATSNEVSAETVAQALPTSVVAPDSTSCTGPLGDRVRAFEKQTILAELKRNHHQISNTARALGLERSHLYKKAEQVGIDLKAAKSEGER